MEDEKIKEPEPTESNKPSSETAPKETTQEEKPKESVTTTDKPKSSKTTETSDVKKVETTPTEKVTNPEEENLFFDEPTDTPEGKVSPKINLITLAVALAVGVFLMFIVSFREVFHKYFNPVLLQRINSIARDVMVLIVIITIILYARFLGAEFFKVHVNGICLCISIFGLSWLLISIVLVIAGQSFSVNWEERETRVKFRGTALLFPFIFS